MNSKEKKEANRYATAKFKDKLKDIRWISQSL